ncbi:hypothetical protein E2C01_049587 [Portunus trituberculatus]|uniref:Uncharacterized protein n=1 Tax=Portunus trituberculatus TaxID=210409 RepID=A0A5B7GGG0_PORTR|nr:hypothetical protein [Portunus trituberculatus]
MMRLEVADLTTQRDTQNFLFWLTSAFFSLTSSDEGSSAHWPMLHQLTHSFQRPLMNQVKITAFALANTRAARKESYFLHLPHCFSSVSKAQLRHIGMDLDLLSDSADVDKAIGQAQQTALVSLTELVTKALIKVKPRPETLWRNIHDPPPLPNLVLVLIQPNNGSLSRASTLAVPMILNVPL